MKRPRIILILALSFVLLAASTASPQQTRSIDPAERTVPAATATDPRTALQAIDSRPSLDRKLEPSLLKTALTGDSDKQIHFIVELDQQADLPSLAGEFSRQTQGSRVVAELKLTARQTQAGLLAFLAAQQAEGHVQRYRFFWVFNGLAVTADADTLLDIADRPEVRHIHEDRWQQWVEPLSIDESLNTVDLQWNLSQIHADLAWDNLDLDGSGVTVGIMDTGVDWQHAALQSQYRGYKPGGLSIHEGNWFCATDEG